MKLRSKFNLASFVLILLVVAGMMGLLAVYEKARLQTEMEREQMADLEKLASVWKDANTTADEPTLLKYVTALVATASPRVAYVGTMFEGNHWEYSFLQDPPLSYVNETDEGIKDVMNLHKILQRITKFKSKPVIEISKPVGPHEYVRIGYSEDVLNGLYREALENSLRRLAMAGGVAIFVGLILAYFFSNALLQPIQNLMTAAEALAKGQKGVKVPKASDDELGSLVHSFNHMSDELAKLDELKDEFMSHVTHELRSPLTTIIATIELMGENALVKAEPKLKRSVDRLIYGSERLNKLVDNILDLMRMEAGKMNFDMQPVDMTKILVEMADFFEPRAQEKGLTIKAVVPPSFPLVYCDPEKVRQVFSNLIYNAIKFTNTGGITLWIKNTKGVAHMAVQDSGVGIPADKLQSVFKRFETIKEVRDKVTKAEPGSGLGLNIVLNSIKAQGGRVWVESQVGKGSAFQFTLAFAPAKTLAAPLTPPQTPPNPGDGPDLLQKAS